MKPLDITALETATRMALAGGHRLLQTHKLSANDESHAWYLLKAMQPPEGAMILDAGCGIGELSRLMSEKRPDLTFILANLSLMQLELCPVAPQYRRLHADCHDLPVRDEMVDVVMFASAISQMEAKFVLHEAARVLKPGGVVFLAEMVRLGGDAAEFERVTTAHVHTFAELEGYAAAAGLKLDFGFTVDSDDSHFRGLLREIGQEALLDPIRLAIMRFIKG
ncbi:methyltransferase domain-containing protein [Caballeronia sp. SEWSISQ10-4 2]|uniref:class I SAM-dependent methyltransferase n=1 Tax=Caballeronia sp. SEWSISQ10-4 2 TaxID=2937438 RepID=UPI002650A7B1|nr:class I SAM-dependent methyltransferase [Caballeronia sp. SEWSISQ10-4 2]MDN7179115.1 methyltransferase domain-containing protein [Caballeronia sp. SEWSISQ10-4 2]